MPGRPTPAVWPRFATNWVTLSFASNQIEEAAAAWTRATVVLPTEQLADHSRIVTKLMDGCLKNAMADPVIALASKAKIPEIRKLIAGRLLEYLQELGRTDRQGRRRSAGQADPGGPRPLWSRMVRPIRGPQARPRRGNPIRYQVRCPLDQQTGDTETPLKPR